MASPASTRTSPCRSTMARMDRRSAPSASRRPNSRVRWLTEVAMTAAMPLTVMTKARAANRLSSSTESRRVAVVPARVSARVRKFSTGCSGSTACTASRTWALRARGSPGARTRTRVGEPAPCRKGR